MKSSSFNKHFANGFRGISKLICSLPTEQKDFVKSMKFDLAHTAKVLSPNASMSELAQITGISRGTISDYLDEGAPESIVSKEAVLLRQLWFNRDENNSIPLKGKLSFFSVARQILNSSYSPTTALESLIALKAVKLTDLEQDKVSVIILQNYLDVAIDKEYELYLSIVGKVIGKFCDTVVFNMQNDDTNYQQTLSSSRVPISVQENLHSAIKSLTNTTLTPLMYKCIERFEEDVPYGTYPEVGFSMFEYRDYKNNANINSDNQI